MPQVWSSLVLDGTPRLHALEIDDSPAHVDHEATEADKQGNRIVRAWAVPSLDSVRVNAMSRDGDDLLLVTNDEPPGPPAATGKLWVFDPGTGVATLRGNLQSPEGSLIGKGMAKLSATTYLLAQVIGGSPFLFSLNTQSGAAQVLSGAAQFGNNDPTSLFAFAGTLYALFQPNAGDQFIQALDPSDGSLTGAALTVNGIANLNLNGLTATSVGVVAFNNGDHRLYRLTLQGNAWQASRIGGDMAIDLVGDCFGLAEKDEPTLTFPVGDFVGPNNVFTDAEHEYGNPTIEGNAGGPVEVQWYESAGAGALSDDDTLVTEWTAPANSGNFVLHRRVLREGVLVENTWDVRVTDTDFSVDVRCPRQVITGGRVTLVGSVTSNVPGVARYQWHRGPVNTFIGGIADIMGFSDPNMLQTDWTAGDMALRQTITLIVTIGTEQRFHECTIDVRDADDFVVPPGTGGSNVVSDFVAPINLPINPAIAGEVSIYRAPAVPAHPEADTLKGIWRSHPIAFGDPIPLNFIGVDAEWKDEAGAARGVVQVLLQGSAGGALRMLWLVLWQAGAHHYMRGRIFTGDTTPFDTLAEGRNIDIDGTMVNTDLAGNGVRQPFPNPDIFPSVEAWRRSCMRSRILSSSRLLIVPLSLGIESREWSLDIITTVRVNSVLIGDDIDEFVTLEPT